MSRKAALVVGASRGIGRQIALTFANSGYDLAICGKTLTKSASSNGSLEEVASQASSASRVLPLQCDVRNGEDIEKVIESTFNEFGRIDTLIYNPGSIFWGKVLDTSVKRMDLMYQVNLRGAHHFLLHAIPLMLEQKRLGDSESPAGKAEAGNNRKGHGSVILVAPPIYSRFLRGKTIYATSKIGLTALGMGLSHDLKGTGVCINSMWPTTGVRSAVTDSLRVPPHLLRQPTVFADACLGLSALTLGDARPATLPPPGTTNADNSSSSRSSSSSSAADPPPSGETFLDEDFLRTFCGVTDFSAYGCVAGGGDAVPRMMPRRLPSLRVEEEEEVLFTAADLTPPPPPPRPPSGDNNNSSSSSSGGGGGGSSSNGAAKL